jgi:hypothetical protein
MEITTLYPHRCNRDGSFDSICPICYVTVARSKQEAELAEIDKAHVCDLLFLAERDGFSRAESARRLALLKHAQRPSPDLHAARIEDPAAPLSSAG